MSDQPFLAAHLVSISDVHVQTPADLKGQRLLALLEEVAAGDVDCLVMVGDIFEFILGSNRFFREKFSPFGEALNRVVASGTRVVYLEGNHEFDLRHLGWSGVEIITDRDYLHTCPDGTKVKFTHGDLVYSPLAYRRFRAVVKSRWFLFLCRFIPGRLMDWLALRGAKASRAQDAYRELDTGRIYDEMKSWLGDDHDVRFGIFGHFHVPFGDPVTEVDGLLISSDCWDNPSVIVYKQEGFRRLTYETGGLLPVRNERLVPVVGPESRSGDAKD